MKYERGLKAAAALAALTLAAGAQAHTFGAHGAGFAAGVAHPFLGIDHLLAMIAVGLWAAQRGGRALWCVPLAFMVTMVVGAMLALFGVVLPAVEAGIAASVLILGLLIAASARLPMLASMLLVGAFAVFHGHAHGTELPQAASVTLYGLGLLAATAALHGLGVGLGMAFKRLPGMAVQVAGSAIAAAGAVIWVWA